MSIFAVFYNTSIDIIQTDFVVFIDSLKYTPLIFSRKTIFITKNFQIPNSLFTVNK